MRVTVGRSRLPQRIATGVYQIALGGVLFVGDTATNFVRLGWGPIYEDVSQGRQSMARLAALDFQVAAFAHGRAIRAHAGERFRARWPAAR